MKVTLVATRWLSPPLGGWYSYTTHMALALKKAGAEVTVVCLQNRRKPKETLGYGIPIHFLDPEEPGTLGVLTSGDVLHVAFLSYKMEKGQLLTDPPAVIRALAWAATLTPTFLTIHDPTELKGRMALTKEILAGHVLKLKGVVAIRKAGLDFLPAGAVYIPHPYDFRAKALEKPKQHIAVAPSRVDFDKNTHIILQAKPSWVEIQFWTGAVNPIYRWHKLKPLGWPPPGYKGGFGREPEDIARVYGPAMAMVDMSSIAGDGGGSQYTFLEAADHRCVMVLHEKWFEKPGSLLVPGESCVTANSPETLAAALDDLALNPERCAQLASAAWARHQIHEAGYVGAQYMQLYKA